MNIFGLKGTLLHDYKLLHCGPAVRGWSGPYSSSVLAESRSTTDCWFSSFLHDPWLEFPGFLIHTLWHNSLFSPHEVMITPKFSLWEYTSRGYGKLPVSVRMHLAAELRTESRTENRRIPCGALLGKQKAWITCVLYLWLLVRSNSCIMYVLRYVG